MNRFRTWWSDRSGGIAPMAAITMAVAIGAGALAVDIGSFYFSRRALQGVADLAAMAAAEAISPARSAAANLVVAQSAAGAVVTANGYDTSTLTKVTLGHYDADPATAPGSRFSTASTATTNGVRVSLSLYAPMMLGRVFLASDATGPHAAEVRIDADAAAASAHFASFDIGTTLATLQGGIANALLSGLLGSSVNLSLMSYNSLLSTQIDLFTFSNALATQVGLTGPTYDSLFQTQAKVSDVMTAIASASRSSPNASTTATEALVQLAGLSTQSSGTVQLSRLIDFGPFNPMTVDGTPLIGASVSAFDLVSQTLGIANGNHMVSANLGVSIPGLAAAKVYLTIGERPVGSPWLSVGAESTSVHTAQTRVLVLATIGVPPLLTINLPIYLEIAAGTASLKSITCEPVNVSVDATPAVVNAWIGNVTPTLMTNTTSITNPGPAPIASVLGLGLVSALANATITNMAPTSLSFSQSDISGGVIHSARTVNYTTSLVANLLSSLQLSLGGIPVLPGGLLSPLSAALSNATAPLDTLLSNVLGALGISLGIADVRVTGLRCDGAVLVQ